MDIRLCDICLGAQPNAIAPGHGGPLPPQWAKFVVHRTAEGKETAATASIDKLCCPDCADLLMADVQKVVGECMDLTRNGSEWVKRVVAVTQP